MFFERYKVQKVKDLIAGAKSIFILTGAGISAASGIPTFRGAQGSLWANLDQMKYAFADALVSDPEGVWKAHEKMRELVDESGPNSAHEALVELSHLHNVNLFTQNVDGYHVGMAQEAFEMHGSINDFVCTNSGCSNREKAPKGKVQKRRITCKECGQPMRHDTVLFGEGVRHFGKMITALSEADLVIFVGTSGLVTDTKLICQYMKQRAVPVVEINTAMLTRVTFCADVVIRSKAEHVLHHLVT